MQENVRISSVDNPFDPFEQFKEWYSYDIMMGYNTCERLGSIVNSVPEALTEEENNYFIDKAIEELIKTGCYSKFGHFVEYEKRFPIKGNKD